MVCDGGCGGGGVCVCVGRDRGRGGGFQLKEQVTEMA